MLSGDNNIIGRAIIIHAKRDDGVSSMRRGMDNSEDNSEELSRGRRRLLVALLLFTLSLYLLGL
jgi:hypothetical protein